MAKEKSRPVRWTEAAGEAEEIVSQMLANMDDLEGFMGNLKSVQEEYEQWKDSLPDSLQGSPAGAKLDEICDLDIDSIASSVRSALEDAEGQLQEIKDMELPQGFGRD